MITTFASGSILNNVFGATIFTPISTYYAGMSTTTISATGSNVTESTGASGYARVAIPNNKSYFTNASNGVLTNVQNVTFPTSSSAQGTMTTFFLADTSASATGHVWFFQDFSSPIAVQANTTVSFSSSAIQISMTN
jgi:hypothetical protein